jgi:hypothetical protein
VLGLFVLLSQPTFADSIQINRVVQTIRPMRGMVDLRVNSLAQDPASPDVKGTLKSGTNKTKNSDGVASSSGGEAGSQQQQVAVEVVGDAIVEGTVCDCGEILVPGGFPKWPLIFLAAIPLIFIHDCEDCDTPPTCTTCNVVVTPTPTPTPPSNTSTPEPATILLFGTGLLAFGATLRRRYSTSKATNQAQTDDE